MKKKGLSLTELLVTVALVGALFLTAVTVFHYNDNVKSRFKSQYKELYKRLSEVTDRLIYDNNGTLDQVFSWHGYESILYRYEPYLDYKKICDRNRNTLQGCWAHDITHGGWFKYNGVHWSNPPDLTMGWQAGGFVLSNGTTLAFHDYRTNTNCKPMSYCADDDYACKSTNYCGVIFADVNGPTGKPNKVGYDLMSFVIYADGLAPGYIYDDCDITNNGWDCGRNIMLGQDY